LNSVNYGLQLRSGCFLSNTITGKDNIPQLIEKIWLVKIWKLELLSLPALSSVKAS